MIRVLHILDSLDMGGIESYLMNIYRHIDRTKVQFDFLIFKENNYFEKEARNLGATIYKCQDSNYFKQVKYVYEIEKKYHYRIVHCHNCALKRMIREVVPSRIAGKDVFVIAHSHNTGTPRHNKLDDFERDVMKNIITSSSNTLFACSYDAAISKYNLKKKDFMLIKNGIDTSKYKFNQSIRDRVRRELEISNQTFVMGNVARLEEQKNQGFLIERFAYYHKNVNHDSKLIIIGDGSKRQELQKLTEELEVANCVHMLGTKSDIPKYLMAMDAFLFPSLYEGLGISLVEAQASGLPCIVSGVIPDEAIVTDLVKKVSLDNVSGWNEELSQLKPVTNRSTYFNQVKKAGYDIADVAKELEEFYVKHWRLISQYKKYTA